MFPPALIVPEFDGLRDFAVRHGISFSMSADLIRAPEVKKLYEKEIQHLQRDLPTYERVRRFELLPAQLTVESGEITPTLKVKRKVVEKKHADLIEKMHQNVA
jgi:long-chain acyl-CoA synthetase